MRLRLSEAGVGDAGQDGGDGLVLPAGDGRGQGDELGDVLVLGAPVVERGDPAGVAVGANAGRYRSGALGADG